MTDTPELICPYCLERVYIGIAGKIYSDGLYHQGAPEKCRYNTSGHDAIINKSHADNQANYRRRKCLKQSL